MKSGRTTVPLSITFQHGDSDRLQVAKDILGLTKLNDNACQLGEGQPISVKYSDRIGEILLANPEVPGETDNLISNFIFNGMSSERYFPRLHARDRQ